MQKRSDIFKRPFSSSQLKLSKASLQATEPKTNCQSNIQYRYMTPSKMNTMPFVNQTNTINLNTVLNQNAYHSSPNKNGQNVYLIPETKKIYFNYFSPESMKIEKKYIQTVVHHHKSPYTSQWEQRYIELQQQMNSFLSIHQKMIQEFLLVKQELKARTQNSYRTPIYERNKTQSLNENYESQFSQMNNKVAKFSQRIYELERQNNLFKQQNVKMQTMIQKHQGELINNYQNFAEKNELLLKIKDYQLQFRQLKVTISSLETQKSKLEEQMYQVKMRLAQKNLQIFQINCKSSAITTSSPTSTDNNSNSISNSFQEKSKISQIQQNYEQKISSLVNASKKLQSELRNQISDKNKQMSQLRIYVGLVQKRQNNMKELKQKYENMYNEKKQQVTKLIESKQNERESFQKQLKHNKKVQELNKQVRQQEQRIHKLEQEKKMLQRKMFDQQQGKCRERQLQQRYRKTKQEFDDITLKYRQISEQFQQSQQARSKLQDKLALACVQVERIRKVMKELQSKLISISEESIQKAFKLETSQKIKQNIEKQYEILEKRYKEQLRRLNQQQNDSDKKQRLYSQLRTKCEQISLSNNKLMMQNKQLANKLQIQTKINQLNELQLNQFKRKFDAKLKDNSYGLQQQSINKLNNILNNEVSTLKNMLELSNQKCHGLQSQNIQFKAKLQKLDFVQLENRELKNKIASLHPLQQQIIQLRIKIAKLNALQQQILHLRNKNNSWSILQEENTQLKNKLASFNSLQQQVQYSRNRIQALQKQNQQISFIQEKIAKLQANQVVKQVIKQVRMGGVDAYIVEQLRSRVILSETFTRQLSIQNSQRNKQVNRNIDINYQEIFNLLLKLVSESSSNSECNHQSQLFELKRNLQRVPALEQQNRNLKSALQNQVRNKQQLLIQIEKLRRQGSYIDAYVVEKLRSRVILSQTLTKQLSIQNSSRNKEIGTSIDSNYSQIFNLFLQLLTTSSQMPKVDQTQLNQLRNKVKILAPLQFELNDYKKRLQNEIRNNEQLRLRIQQLQKNGGGIDAYTFEELRSRVILSETLNKELSIQNNQRNRNINKSMDSNYESIYKLLQNLVVQSSANSQINPQIVQSYIQKIAELQNRLAKFSFQNAYGQQVLRSLFIQIQCLVGQIKLTESRDKEIGNFINLQIQKGFQNLQTLNFV